MTHTRNRFPFRICGVFRVAVCSVIIISSLVFIHSNAESGPAYDAMNRRIEDYLRERYYSGRLANRIVGGSLKVQSVEPISKQKFKVRGTYKVDNNISIGLLHAAWNEYFECTVKMILDDIAVLDCHDWYR